MNPRTAALAYLAMAGVASAFHIDLRTCEGREDDRIRPRFFRETGNPVRPGAQAWLIADTGSNGVVASGRRRELLLGSDDLVVRAVEFRADFADSIAGAVVAEDVLVDDSLSAAPLFLLVRDGEAQAVVPLTSDLGGTVGNRRLLVLSDVLVVANSEESPADPETPTDPSGKPVVSENPNGQGLEVPLRLAIASGPTPSELLLFTPSIPQGRTAELEIISLDTEGARWSPVGTLPGIGQPSILRLKPTEPATLYRIRIGPM